MILGDMSILKNQFLLLFERILIDYATFVT